MNTRVLPLLLLLGGWLNAAGLEEDDPILNLKSYVYGQSRTNLTTVEQLVRQSLGDPQRGRDVERRLLQVLDSDASFDARQFVCRQLRLAGTDLSVPSLSRLLNDPKLSHMARYALEAMTSPVAGTALRQALRTTRGDLLVGVVNSLGERHDFGSVPAMLPLLSGRDVAVARSVITALGKIGGEPSLDALRAVAANYDPAAAQDVLIQVKLADDVKLRLDVTVLIDALLACADSFAKAGNTDVAAEICARVYEAGPVSLPQRIAALQGLIHSAPARATPHVLKLLRSTDGGLQTIAAGFVRELPLEAVRQFVLLLDALPAETQVLLIQALADLNDKALVAPFLKATQNPNPSVRLAALRGLGTQEGTAEVVQQLVAAAAEPDPVGAAARDSLRRLRGPAVDDTLLAGINQGPTSTRIELIRCTAARDLKLAVPGLLKAAGDPEASVRLAALEALAPLARPDQLPPLLERLRTATSAEERAAAGKTVAAVLRRNDDVEARTQPILEALGPAPKTAKGALLAVLGQLGGTNALRAVVAAARDPDLSVRGPAIETLASWPDPSALEDLLAIAKNSANPTQRTVALRGYVQMVEQLNDRTPAQLLELYRPALAVAARPEDKKLVLGGLGNVAELGALQLAQPFLGDTEVKNEAGLAISRIARAVANTSPPAARAAVDQVLAQVQSEPVRAQARQTIDFLERTEDFINAWMLAGPYTKEGANDNALFDLEFAPERGDTTVAWRPAQAEEGIVPLDRLIGGENRVAYLRTSLTSPKAQPAQLQIGSDDGVKVWLNGKVVHAHNINRGYTAGEDKVEVSLSEGKNMLLLKVTQGGGGWATGCRIRAPDGTKLTGLTVKAE